MFWMLLNPIYIAYLNLYQKSSRRISRVLYPQADVCHLSRTRVTTCFKQSTPRHRTGSPTASVYLILQPVTCTTLDVTIKLVGSYPAFSPLPE